MKNIILIIVLFSFQVSAKEVWNPFGIKLGKELPNSLEVINFDSQCLAHTLRQKDIKLKCYQVKVNHSLFANFTYVAINNDETLSNYNIGDVLAVDVWKTNTNKSFSKCYQRIIDMRARAMNEFGYTTANNELASYEVIDNEYEIVNDEDNHYHWFGKKHNILFRVWCSRSYDGSSSMQWVLTDIKLNTGADDV